MRSSCNKHAWGHLVLFEGTSSSVPQPLRNVCMIMCAEHGPRRDTSREEEAREAREETEPSEVQVT